MSVSVDLPTPPHLVLFRPQEDGFSTVGQSGRRIVWRVVSSFFFFFFPASVFLDEHCLFPLAAVDAASFKREESEEPQNAKRVVLTQVDEQPEEISKSYLDVEGEEAGGKKGGAESSRDAWSFFVFDPATAGGGAPKDPRKKSPLASSTGRLALAVGTPHGHPLSRHSLVHFSLHGSPCLILACLWTCLSRSVY